MDNNDLIEKARNKIHLQYEKNIAFFKQNMTSIYETLCANTSPVKLSISPITGRLEELSGLENIYQGDALTFAINEVKNFYEKMKTFDYRPSPELLVLNHLIKKKAFHNTITDYAKDYIVSPAKKPELMDLVIFGSGLGYHIEILCNKKDFTHYTIIENDIEIFKQSLFTIDWSGILYNLGKDRKISILINDPSKPEKDFLNRIQFHLVNLFPSSAISTLTYSHAYGKNNEKYEKLKKEIFDFNIYSRVAYERLGPDSQRLMNANQNCKEKTPAINLDKSSIKNKKTPIAIIGAGPSLDKYIEILKNNQEKIIIVTCGSALESALKNNIKPDYHFELEFLNLATDLLEHTNKKYPLNKIKLLCSFEGNPNYKRFFESTNIFIQATTELVSNISNEYVLFYGGLTCTNGATALITRICNNDIYFFGMDFAHTYGEHHAKDNITNQNNLPEKLNELEVVGNELKKSRGIITKDTHGNDIETTPALNSARALMEELCSVSENNYFNCSDGANIKNSQYISTEDLKETFSKNKTKKGKIDFSTNIFDASHIHKVSKNILETSFDVCNQILDIAKNIDSTNQHDACLKVSSLITNLKVETNKPGSVRYGQYRSIMSFNRQPLLLLFGILNFCSKENYKSVLETWISDYSEFVDFAKEKMMHRFETNDFLVNEEWLDTYT